MNKTELIQSLKHEIISLYLNDKKSMGYIASLYGFSRNSISKYLKLWGVPVRSPQERRKYNLKPLLDDTPSAYYWVGFLLADGCFKDDFLCCELSRKDSSHLKKLLKYLNYQNYKTKNSITCKQPLVLEIRHKFGIQNRKTYNPPDLSRWSGVSKDNLLSLFIGFIDGDGCIKKNSYTKNTVGNFLTIHLHYTWKPFLQLFITCLQNYYGVNLSHYKVTRLRKNCCKICIANRYILTSLKKDAIRLGLPILKRKWDRIKLEQKTQYEKAIKLNKKILNLYNQGLTTRSISDRLNISIATVQRHIYKRDYSNEHI